MALARKSHQSQTEREFCEILQMADPIVSRFVSEHEALKRRNEALLERVAVLERALEKVREIADDDWYSREARTGEHPRYELREVLSGVLDG